MTTCMSMDHDPIVIDDDDDDDNMLKDATNDNNIHEHSLNYVMIEDLPESDSDIIVENRKKIKDRTGYFRVVEVDGNSR